MRQWEHLTPGSKVRVEPGARRRHLLAFSAALVLHLLLFVRFGSVSPPGPIAPNGEKGSVIVSLIPEFANNSVPAPQPVPPAPSPSPPTQQEQPGADQADANSSTPLAEAQLTSVSLTAAPTSLSAVAPPTQTAGPVVAAATAGDPCDLTGALQVALQANAQVVDELSRIPRQARSVANAIMLWDGRWTPVEAPAYPAMTDPLRQAIIDTVRALPPACQAQPVVGPRLLSITNPTGATIIALGSGSWTWGDLLNDPQAAF